MWGTQKHFGDCNKLLVYASGTLDWRRMLATSKLFIFNFMERFHVFFKCNKHNYVNQISDHILFTKLASFVGFSNFDERQT